MSRLIFSDLHGMGCLWDNIKNYIKPEDQLWFLGDAADRGLDGYRIMKEILAHPQITYLKGNHEMMLSDAILEWQGDDSLLGSINLLYENDGAVTFEDFMNNGCHTGLAMELRRLPSYVQLEAGDGRIVHLSHAGFSSDKPRPPVKELLWDRKHIDDEYEDEASWVIHGHTPTCYFYTKKEEITEELRNPAPILYGNKICLDLGSFATQTACLFDIDTMKPIFFNAAGRIDK